MGRQTGFLWVFNGIEGYKLRFENFTDRQDADMGIFFMMESIQVWKIVFCSSCHCLFFISCLADFLHAVCLLMNMNQQGHKFTPDHHEQKSAKQHVFVPSERKKKVKKGKTKKISLGLQKTQIISPTAWLFW